MAKAFSALEVQEGIIVDRNMREALASHVEALDRAGKLLTMPKVNMATTEQVAEFFKVPFKTIHALYDRNFNELQADGAETYTITGLKSSGCRFESVGQSGYTGMKLDDGSVLKVPTRGLRLFPKRAVLRIAMLLTGSEVAKAVRTALLNLTEKVEQRVPELAQEMMAEMSGAVQAMIMSFASGDIKKTAESFMEITSWQSRKLNAANATIAELKDANATLDKANQELSTVNQELTTANESLGTVNRMLIGEYAPLSPRKTVMAIIRAVNMAQGRDASAIRFTYNEFYRELMLHEGIHLKRRQSEGVTGRAMRNPPACISLVRESEWPNVMRCLAWFCSRYSVDPWYVTNDATVEKYGLDKAEYDGKVYQNKRMVVKKIDG